METNKKALKAYKPNIPDVLAIAFYLLLFFRAITTIDTYWDSLAYHLPFAGRLVGIITQNEFILSQQIEEYYAGFPKLAEWLQGIFWQVTGRIAGTNLVSWFSVLAVNIVASIRLRLKFWNVALVLFSVPLIVIHSTTSYIDIIAGSFFGIGLINLLASVNNNNFTPYEFLAIGIPLALAANVKYNLSVLSIIILILVTLLFIFANKSSLFRKENRKQLFLYITFGIVIIGFLSGFMIKNWINYENPVYPLSAKLGPIQFAGGERSPYNYEASSSGLATRFKSYLISLSEIPLWQQNPETLWIIDMSNFRTPEGSALYRIGGYFGINIFLWTIIIILSVFMRKHKIVIYYAISVLFLFILVGVMPSSMMLRYWLFLPMILGIFSVFLIEYQIKHKQVVQKIFIATQLLIFGFVIYQTQDFVIPHSFDQENRIVQAYHLNIDEEGICVSENPPLGFLYKMANPELIIQSVGLLDECNYPLLEDVQ